MLNFVRFSNKSRKSQLVKLYINIINFTLKDDFFLFFKTNLFLNFSFKNSFFLDDPEYFKNNSLPLARIKKIMKLDEEVKVRRRNYYLNFN